MSRVKRVAKNHSDKSNIKVAKVKNLKRITILLEAGTSPDKMDLTLQHSEFEFLFGLSPAGMTPFEFRLIDKIEKDEVLLHLTKDEIPITFEHLRLPIMNLFENRERVYLKVKILKIQPTDNREIIKAMAEMAGHESGCDCGCGC